MKVLVIGGAGYIGSVTVRLLLERGHEPVVMDNLGRGHAASVPAGVPLEPIDTNDMAGLRRVVEQHQPDAAVYYAGLARVGESMEDPGKYFANNVSGIINVCDVLLANSVTKLVFSSSAAVYGIPIDVPIDENARTQPVNPYGESKLITEQMLRWYGELRGLNSVSLRYFNAAGAAFGTGEDHQPESHLVPAALRVALGKAPHLQLFGTDYPTPDGTCVRDYVHVYDLAEAHLLAIAKCGTGSAVYNLGNGAGFSNREVIEVCREVSGHPIPVMEAPRREGDPAVLVASAARAKAELGWKPRHTALRDIVGSAWEWHRGHPDGW